MSFKCLQIYVKYNIDDDTKNKAEANRLAEANGSSDMTPDEINAEITAAGKERKRVND